MKFSQSSHIKKSCSM